MLFHCHWIAEETNHEGLLDFMLLSEEKRVKFCCNSSCDQFFGQNVWTIYFELYKLGHQQLTSKTCLVKVLFN